MFFSNKFKKTITFVGVQYNKSENQIKRMINSFIAVEKYSNWIIFYDKVDKVKIAKIIEEQKLNEENFKLTNGVRIERISKNLNFINTKYVMIIDGDDYIDKKSAINLFSKLKRCKNADLIYLNNYSFYVKGDILEPDVRNFYHPSYNFVTNVIFSKKILEEDELFLLKNNFNENDNDYEGFAILFKISDQLLSINYLSKAKKIVFLKITSPYVREFESETSSFNFKNRESGDDLERKFDIARLLKKEGNVCSICPIHFKAEDELFKLNKEKAIVLSSINTYHEKHLIRLNWNVVYENLSNDFFLIKNVSRLTFAYLFYKKDIKAYGNSLDNLLLNIETLKNITYKDSSLNFIFDDNKLNFSLKIWLKNEFEVNLFDLIKSEKFEKINSFFTELISEFQIKKISLLE